ncbi:MAG: crossover junction endodeoxyribonuclease RuvC [Thermodesulfobacteria bacterium]|nr:crossover junction endodeoxyribonuclease RuvC [Thermodesulfobacteriota bacterium]
MRVLGIDPGSRVMGYGIIEAPQKPLAWGALRLKESPLPLRLRTIFHEITALIAEYNPEAVALEDVIPQSFPHAALKLGQAQGAAILAAVTAEKPVFFYHPLEVKKALTGYGSAPKEQLRFMVCTLLEISSDLPTDASDALAVALYHLQRSKYAGPS